MKKLFLISMAIISASFLKAQPVADIAIIPVGVSLNSILRLQVVSGGNIEFGVNTISQYINGVTGTTGTTTTFTVSSTLNYEVNLYAEGANLVGTDLGQNMDIKNLGYYVSYEGTLASGGAISDYTLVAVPSAKVLTGTKGASSVIITPAVGKIIAGDVVQNKFAVKWELATSNVLTATGGLGATNTLLKQNLKADRYVVNTFLDLDAK